MIHVKTQPVNTQSCGKEWFVEHSRQLLLLHPNLLLANIQAPLIAELPTELHVQLAAAIHLPIPNVFDPRTKQNLV
jgi:hypothetical protein